MVSSRTQLIACWILLLLHQTKTEKDLYYEDTYPERFESLRHRRDLSTINQGYDNHVTKASFVVRAFGKRYVIDLQRRDGLSRNIAVRTFSNGKPVTSMVEPQSCFYEGKIRDEPGSMALISTCRGLRGVIESNDANFYIEPSDDINKRHLHRVYRDEVDELTTDNCGTKNKDGDFIITKNKFNQTTQSRPKRYFTDVYDAYKPFLTTEETRYNEIIFVVDNGLFKYFDSDVEKTKEKVFMLANIIDSIYLRANIRVVLVALEIWTDHDRIERKSTGGMQLREFTNYKNAVLKYKFKFDNAHFLSSIGWADGIVGMAYLAKICSPTLSCGINRWKKTLLSGPIVAVAHEMGHNFGFSHDVKGGNCICLTPRGCFMGGFKTRLPGFSDCSLRSLAKADDSCLYNYPDHVVTPPTCGNGIMEEGEECDCGTEETCSKMDVCCEPYKCKLKSHAQCSNTEACCTECTYSKHGTLCRAAKSMCDFEEYCTGKSATCVQDVFDKNGRQCSNNRKLFHGNTNSMSVEFVTLERRISAKALRIHPQYFRSKIAMRLELYGCAQHEVDHFTPTPIQAARYLCASPSIKTCDVDAMVDGTKLFLTKGELCEEDYMKFVFTDTGILKHHCTGLNVCVKQKNVIISKDCSSENSKWKRTDKSAILHIASGKCITPYSGWFADGKILLVNNGCDKPRNYFNFMEQDCVYPLGMKDGRIPAVKITSSSQGVSSDDKSYGRLTSNSPWVPRQHDKYQWITIDLSKVHSITAIATQGGQIQKSWVSGYFVDYSINGQYWNHITENDDLSSNCYDGLCSATRATQCRDIWGPRTKDGAQACYDKFNTEANGFGTCELGKNSSCLPKDVLCGQLQCDSTVDTPVTDIGWFYTHDTVDGSKCSKLTLKNDDEIGEGMVRDGTRCGENKMCIDNKCQAFKEVSKTTTKEEKDHKPVDGGWSAWSIWTSCTRACGGGKRTKHRFCDSPIVMYGGADCVGERVVEEICNGTPCPVAFSCRHLQQIGKLSGVQYPDGIYTIDPKGNHPIKAYCDMTRDGGGWTLLVTSKTNTWTHEKVLSTNTQNPRLDDDYSILSFADSINRRVGVSGRIFHYRLEAQTLGSWGGIWAAPRHYTFVSENNEQTDVLLTTKFDNWAYSDRGVAKRMPWISNATLTTSATLNENHWGWGSVTGNFIKYYPAAWMGDALQEEQPKFIWYWMREGEYNKPRTCQDLQLSQYDLSEPLNDGLFEITPGDDNKIKTYCNTKLHGGGWTLIWTRKTTAAWDDQKINCRPSKDPMNDDFSITDTFRKYILNTKSFQYVMFTNEKPGNIETANKNDVVNVIKSAINSGQSVNHLFVRETTQRSCNEIKLKAKSSTVEELKDGFYMIRKPNSDDYLPVYCDMTSYPGAFTLLVTSAHGGWTPSQVLSRNEQNPSTYKDYSILHLADYIKQLGNNETFMYKVDAANMGHWGGVWKAPNSYSFTNNNNKQTDVNLVEKFDNWKYSWSDSIERRMPWVVGSGKKALLTTSSSSSYYPFGTIIFATDEYKPAPWLKSPGKPGFIWYWVNEDDCDTNRQPVDGGLTEWTPWKCDCKIVATAHRSRKCANPKPRCGGQECSRVELQQEKTCSCPASPIRTSNNLCLAPESGECNVSEGTKLTIQKFDEKCSAQYLQFSFNPSGVIRHLCSDKVVCTEDNASPKNGRLLVLRTDCSPSNSEFIRTPIEALQSKSNRDVCVHPKGGKLKVGKAAIFWKGCDDEKKLKFEFINLHD